MRYKEHVGPGEDFDAGYRQAAGVNAWKASDPLEDRNRFADDLVSRITDEIETAVEFALSSPFSDHSELLTDVL